MSASSSNAILTKIRAIYGNRLTLADYAQMARKTDVGEVAAFLKENTSYASALHTLSETDVHRGQLESMLKKDLFYRYSALRRYDFSGRGFYDFILFRKEIDEIIRRLTLLQLGDTEAYVTELPAYLLGNTSFSLLELAKADSFDSLLECLKSTPYWEILKGFGHRTAADIPVLDCEYALYGYYYRKTMERIKKEFRGRTRSQLEEIQLMEIEAVNIQTVFRLKLYFQLPPEKIRTYLHPYAYKLRKDVWDRLLAAGNFDEMWQLLAARTKAANPLAEEEGIEKYTHRSCYHMEQKLLRFTTEPPVAMYAFMTLRRMEVENIITVIEGVRYSLPQEEILSMLII